MKVRGETVKGLFHSEGWGTLNLCYTPCPAHRFYLPGPEIRPFNKLAIS